MKSFIIYINYIYTMENQELQNDNKKKVITVYPTNTEWRHGNTKKGEKTLYRR